MKKFKAILFSHDGEAFETDCEADTVNGVWQEYNNIGNKWFFYPFVFVIRNNKKIAMSQRIVDMPYQFENKNLKTIKDVIEYLKNNPELIKQLVEQKEAVEPTKVIKKITDPEHATRKQAIRILESIIDILEEQRQGVKNMFNGEIWYEMEDKIVDILNDE